MLPVGQVCVSLDCWRSQTSDQNQQTLMPRQGPGSEAAAGRETDPSWVAPPGCALQNSCACASAPRLCCPSAPRGASRLHQTAGVCRHLIPRHSYLSNSPAPARESRAQSSWNHHAAATTLRCFLVLLLLLLLLQRFGKAKKKTKNNHLTGTLRPSQSSGCCATMFMLLLCLKFFSRLSPCNLVLEQHNVSACFCDIRHSLSKWRACACVRAFPFSSVWPGVHGGGVAEGVERAVEVGLQRAQNTLQHQRHRRVSSAHRTVPSK